MLLHYSRLPHLPLALSSPSVLYFLQLVFIHFLQTATADVTSVSYYHSDLSLDFLCQSRTIPAFVRDVPWDCTSYVVCLRGKAFFSQCPGDKLFSGRGRGLKCLHEDLVDVSRCRGQLFEYVDQICQENPSARIPSENSCGHYVDCQARKEALAALGQETGKSSGGANFMAGLLECSYPLLFSPATGTCQHHSFVRCRHKFEPKAPCDYLQYLQLYDCTTLDCRQCHHHHPSCLSLPDGFHPVPQRTDVIMKCQGERTVDFVTCPPGYTFSAPKGGNQTPHCVRA